MSLETENESLRSQLHAMEDRLTRTETEAQDLYETANSALQKSLETAQERIKQLERENGTLALSVSYLRAQLGAEDETVAAPTVTPITTTEDGDKRVVKPPFSPMRNPDDAADIS